MRLALLAGVIALALPLAACGGSSPAPSGEAAKTVELLNVSYDPTRELYEDFNKAFATEYKATAGVDVKINQSHAGSGKQARTVIDGLEADVVTLALQGDIDVVAKSGLINPDWQTRLEANSAPYTSTIVLVVRKGNPKAIKDWADLAKPDVKIVWPNPKTSGGARWGYLAAWAYGDKTFNKDEAKVKAFVGSLYKNTPVLDTGARGSTTTFAQRNVGDVLVTWENEAYLPEFSADKFEVVYPSISILAEPPVAVVDKNVDKHGTRAAAEAYLKYLYSPVGQKIAAKHHYRPIHPNDADPADIALLKPIELVNIRDAFGGWDVAQKKHFDEAGVFDQLYTPPPQ